MQAMIVKRFRVPAEVRGVLFDLDDTLFDHTGAATAAVRSWATTRLPGSDPEVVLASWWRAEDTHHARFTRGEISHHEQRRARLRDIDPDTAGWTDAELDADFAGYLAAYRASWVGLPGAVDAVQRGIATGRRVGVLTNGESAQQRAKLHAIGIPTGDGPGEVCLLASAELTAMKPHPDAYRDACGRLGLAPAEVIMIGDNLVNDVTAALQAGLRAVLVSSDPAPTPGIPVVPGVEALDYAPLRPAPTAS